MKRLRLGPRTWGLSSRWLAFCPWNGDEAWLQLPFVYLAVGTQHAELMLGRHPAELDVDVRWWWP